MTEPERLLAVENDAGRITISEPTTEPQPTGDGGPTITGPRVSRSLLSGAGVMLASRLVVAALGYSGTVIIARELSSTHFGSFAVIFNLLGLLGLVCDFETSRIVIAELATSDDVEGIAGRFVVFRIALGAVTYALALVIALVGPYSRIEVQGIAIGGISFFVSTTLWAVVSVCQAKLWLRAVAGALVAGQVVQLAMIVGLHTTHHGSTLRYVAPFVVSDAVALVVLAVAIRGVVRIRPRVDRSRWWQWLRAAAPLALGSALGTLYFRIDSIMLSWIGHGRHSRVDVGLYQIGYKFSDLLAFVAPALIASLLPLLTRAWPDRRDEFRRIWRHALLLVVAIAGIATAGFAALAPRVIPFLFTARYAGATAPARWLVAGQALNFVTQLCYVTLVATNRHRIFPIATFTGVVVNVGLNIVLIPRHGVMGAAVATVITECVVIAMLVRGFAGMALRPLPIRGLVVVLSSAVLTGGLIVAALHVMAWPVAGMAGALLFLGALHALGVDGPGGLPAFVRAARIDLD